MPNKEQHEKVIKETKLLVKLFLKVNASDITLSKLTKISSSTVGRRLTNKENILEAFPENGEELFELIRKKRQENAQKGKLLGSQVSLLNQLDIASKTMTNLPALRFDIFFSDENKQMMFIMHMALTFKTELSTVASLLQMDTKELESKMVKANPDSNYYFYEMRNLHFAQNDAKKRFVLYYMELLNALRMEESDTLHHFIEMVTDAKAGEFLKNRQKGDNLSDQDIITILTYQLKYFIPTADIAKIFGVDRANYIRKVKKICETNQGLRKRYEFLGDFYYNAHIDSTKRHQEGRK